MLASFECYPVTGKKVKALRCEDVQLWEAVAPTEMHKGRGIGKRVGNW